MKTKKKSQKAVQTIEAVTPVSKNLYLVLSFVFPVVIMGIAFALNRVYPFGGKDILILDLRHQHYPFLSDLWHKLRAGSLAPWSWTASAGHDYIALVAYYLGSPLNLLAFIFPHAYLPEALTLILLIKIGLAGLFMGMYLRSASRQYEPALPTGSLLVAPLTLPIFASLYALCAFTLGYYWTIIWFDGFALLPLVMMGFQSLMNENKYRLYVVALALALLTNFYMGLFICIFVAITFFNQCIIQNFNRQDFLSKLGLTATCSILAVGMSAVLLIPAYSAIQDTSRAASMFPDKITWYNSFFDVLGNFIAFTPPTLLNGLPNLYSGLICILLFGLFIYSPKVSRREKIVLAGTVVFLLVSCNLNVLYYMWNFFRNTYDLPGRFSFLLSFTLVAIAYRMFLSTEKTNRQGLLVMGISTSVVLLAAAFGTQGKGYIIASVVLCALYLLLLYLSTNTNRAHKVQQFATMALLLLMLAELSVTSYVAIKQAELSSKDKNPDHYEQIQALLDLRQPVGNDFYRTEVDSFDTLNDPSLYNYNGISFFSSTVNANLNAFMGGLGLMHDNVTFGYAETTPFVDAFLNMRYGIAMEGNLIGDGVYWQTVGKIGASQLMENKYYLPLGFMAHNDITGYVHDKANPFLSQNNLFRRATGIDADLLTITDLTDGTSDSRKRDYEMPSDGLLYLHSIKGDLHNTIAVFINGTHKGTIDIFNTKSCILALGGLAQGDIVSFEPERKASIFVGRLNLDVFKQGYSLLAEQPLKLTKFTNTEVIGEVTALRDGVLYTSIPGDKNWSVFVDGVKSKIVLIDKAMAAVRLSEGTHTVEFRYFNKSFVAGIVVSLVSLVLFVVIAFLLPRQTLRSGKVRLRAGSVT